MPETLFTVSRMWAAALVVHDRSWNFSDKKSRKPEKEYLKEFGAYKGDRSPKNYRKFLTQFEVVRNVPANHEDQLFQKVSKVVAGWSNKSLICKAESLNEIYLETVQKDGKQKIVRTKSAFSKTAWFIQPNNWTPFDSRAKAVVGEGTFLQFYQKLQDHGVEELYPEIQNCLSKYPKYAYAERVVDKALFILGSHTSFKEISGVTCEEALTLGQEIAQLKEAEKFHCLLKKTVAIQ
ncbi:MAG: hypothetical protein ACU0CA_13820 [Paracoccaceae bacterium]